MNGPDCLDQVARDVIIQGRYAIAPGLAVRDRVQQRVLLRLGAGAATLLATRSLWAAIGKWTAATVLVGAALGGMLYWRFEPGQADLVDKALPIAARAVDVPASSMAVSKALPPAGDELAPAAPNSEEASSPSPRLVPSTQPRSSDLAAEIELLAQANAALNRGDSGRARQLLSNYDRKFGAGVLREERSAAEVLVLCAAGDKARARAAAARFEKRWPRSPLKVRVEASCLGTE